MLWPIRRHPALPEESRYLIDQYMLNLNRNSKGESMAQVNKKICEELYGRYQTVFDQIYLAVGKEPLLSGGGTRLHRFAVTLSDLVDRGLLSTGAALSSDYGEGGHSAVLGSSPDGVQVQLDGDNERGYPSLSKAASAITGRPTNGWTFWKTKDRSGNMVSLDTLRDRFDQE